MEEFGCFCFGLKKISTKENLGQNKQNMVVLFAYTFPLKCSFESGVSGQLLYLPVAPVAPPSQPTWRLLLLGEPVTLAPFSRQLLAHFSQGPFPESLRECPAAPSLVGALPVLRLDEDAGRVPFCTVSPGRGTLQPRPCLLHRSRRPCCRSYFGPPADLPGVVLPALQCSE